MNQINPVDDEIFNNFSDESSSSPFQLYEVTELLVILSHKPRGSKGVWQQVHKDEKLRVTKGKGKRLRLEVQLTDECQSDSTKLFLTSLDGDVPTVLTEGVTLEAAKTIGKLLEMEIKLYEVCKRLQFLVQVTTHSGATVTGRSIEFMTHNSGTASTSVRHKEKSPDIASSAPLAAPPMVSTPEDHSKKRVRTDESPASSPPTTQDVTILPNSLEVNGDVKARAYLQFSDIRLKTNVVDLVDALSIVTALQGKSYEWKKGTSMEASIGGQRVIGLIAQEVQRVLPEVVHEDPTTGILAVSYIEILPVVIEAFKQFLNEYKDNKKAVQTQLDELRGKIDAFQNQKTKKERDQILEKLTLSSRKMTAIFRDKSDVEKANADPLAERAITIYPQAGEGKQYHKLSKGRFLVCRMTQIVFVISLILSTGLFIAGLLLMIPNVPKTSNTEIVDSGDHNVSVVHESKRMGYGYGWRRAEPENITDVTMASTTASDIFIIEQEGLDTDFVIGVVLLCLGVLGMIISGIGLLFSSVWMCSGQKT